MIFHTRQFFILLFLIICVVYAKKEDKNGFQGIFECKSGERYQENKCNYCICKDGELFACSLMICDNLPFYDMAKNCTIGRKWKEECNICQCARNYGTVCTVEDCNDTTITDKKGNGNDELNEAAKKNVADTAKSNSRKAMKKHNWKKGF